MATIFGDNKTRDSIGTYPDKQDVIIVYTDTINLEVEPIQIKQDTIGNSWICGSSTNGIVGTNTNTQGGGQQVVGASSRTQTVLKVNSINNFIVMRFYVDTLNSTTSTGYWDTTNGRLCMSSSDNHFTIYNKHITTTELYKDTNNVAAATLNIDETKWNPSDTILYYLNVTDYNINWEQVQINKKHTFANTGNKLRLMVIFIGNGGKSTYVENLKINMVIQ